MRDNYYPGAARPTEGRIARRELMACPSASMSSDRDLGDTHGTSGRHIARCHLGGDWSNRASARKYGGFAKRWFTRSEVPEARVWGENSSTRSK